MAAEAGKTVAEADPEISEAIDFARYYADRALELEPSSGHAGTDGARFIPTAMTLVTPPWNFPVAIPIGGALAALAAGSAVVIKPAPPVPACAEVAAAAVRAALAHGGAPADILQVVRSDEGEVGRALVSHRGIDTVLLTGSIDTARLFASWRASHEGGPRVFGETSGKNALIITASADFDLAVADLVKSAVQARRPEVPAASLVILTGRPGATATAPTARPPDRPVGGVGWPVSGHEGPADEPTWKLSGVDSPSREPCCRAEQLDDTGRLCRGPGAGVPQALLQSHECFGPFGIMRRQLD